MSEDAIRETVVSKAAADDEKHPEPGLTGHTPEDPFGDETGVKVYKNVEWWQCSFLMIAETVSLGILSLPKVVSTMGYIPGFFLILILGLLSTYTGYTIGQFRHAHPSIHSFADAADFVFPGSIARHIISVAQATVLVFIAAAHVLTFSIMMNVLTGHATCTVTFAAVGTILSAILTLPRTLRNVSWLSALSCASIISAVIIAMIGIGITRPDPDSAVLVVTASSLSDYAMGISNIIISFSGHTTYFSFIAELRKPSDFPKSLALLNTLCVTAYVVVAVVIYAYAGEGVTSPALSSASPIIRKVAYGVAIPTIVIAGVVNAHVCVKNIYMRYWRGTSVPHEVSFRSLGSWYLLTALCYICAFIIANAIPVFSDLLGILGSLLVSWFSVGLPAVFWLALNKRRYTANWRKMTLTALNVFIFALCCFTCGTGTWASVKSIAASSVTRKPFSCLNNS